MSNQTIRPMRDELRNHPYARVFVLLLLTVLALLGVSALSWCDCGCDCDGSSASPQQIATQKELEVTTVIFATHNVLQPVWPGYPANETIHASMVGQIGSHPDHVTLTYTPPPGATDVSYSKPPDEVRPDGTLVWNNVPTHAGSSPNYYVSGKITVYFDAPKLPEGQTSTKFTTTASTILPNGDQHNGSLVTTLEYPYASHSTSPVAQPVEIQPGPQPQTDYYLWHFETHSGVVGLRLTTQLCEQWAAVTDPSKAFIAVRFPLLNATPPYTDSYSLPVVFSSAYSPTLALQDERTWPSTTLLTVPLQYRPEYHTFVNAELPWEDDERWFALGVKQSTSISCPQGMDLPAGKWGIFGHLWLEFRGQSCANCTLPVYLCYEGQELPSLASAAARASGVTAASYQGWGITCLGPILVPLEDYSPPMPFYLYGTYSTVVTPTQQVRFLHHLYRGLGTAPQATLSVSSTLHASWGFYECTEPGEPLVPIQQPISLAQWQSRTFCIVGTVPADAHGPHSLTITATPVTNPSQVAQVSDVLWVGDWEEPPPPPRWYYIRFPVVIIQ